MGVIAVKPITDNRAARAPAAARERLRPVAVNLTLDRPPGLSEPTRSHPPWLALLPGLGGSCAHSLHGGDSSPPVIPEAAVTGPKAVILCKSVHHGSTAKVARIMAATL